MELFETSHQLGSNRDERKHIQLMFMAKFLFFVRFYLIRNDHNYIRINHKKSCCWFTVGALLFWSGRVLTLSGVLDFRPCVGVAGHWRIWSSPLRRRQCANILREAVHYSYFALILRRLIKKAAFLRAMNGEHLSRFSP